MEMLKLDIKYCPSAGLQDLIKQMWCKYFQPAQPGDINARCSERPDYISQCPLRPKQEEHSLAGAHTDPS